MPADVSPSLYYDASMPRRHSFTLISLLPLMPSMLIITRRQRHYAAIDFRCCLYCHVLR